MKKLFFLTVTIMLTAPCFAILSPLNQSAEEINMILKSHDLQNSLPQGESIQSIERLENGYIVKTQRQQVEITVQYFPAKAPGKQPFILKFHPPIPIHQ